MASVVAVRSNTGSTIAIIVAVLAVGAVGIFLASRAIKDFKFPDFSILKDFKFPEFKFPELFPGPTLEDAPDLSLIPQGEGISLEQLKQAFKISFPTGTVSRSVGARPILPVGAIGVIGKRIPPRAIALRTPTFIIVREGAMGAPIIGGSKRLVDRIAANLRRATARIASIPKPVPKFGSRPPLPTSGRVTARSVPISTRLIARRAARARTAARGAKHYNLRRRFRR